MEDFRNYTTVIDTQYVRFGEMGRSLGTALKHYGLAKEVIIERKKSKSKTYSDLIHGVEIGHDALMDSIYTAKLFLEQLKDAGALIRTGPRHGPFILDKILYSCPST